LNLQSIGNQRPIPVAAARLSSVRARNTSVFSIEGQLPQASARNAGQSGSQLFGVTQQIRQSSVQAPPTGAPTTSTGNLAVAGPTLQAQPFYITNPNYNPADPASPAVIQDPTATATPQAVQWTSANGLTTTGIMNPFGLTQNNPAIGFFGAHG